MKSLKKHEWLDQRVGWRQRRKLRLVANALAEGAKWRGRECPRDVELWLMTVGETKASVQVYADL